MKNTKARNLKIYKHNVISEKSFSTHMSWGRTNLFTHSAELQYLIILYDSHSF